MPDNPYDPLTVCQHVGQIYLQSRFELQRLAEDSEKTIALLRQQLEQVNKQNAELSARNNQLENSRCETASAR